MWKYILISVVFLYTKSQNYFTLSRFCNIGNEVYNINRLEDYYQFLKSIYSKNLSEATINKKYDLMVGSGNGVTVFQIKIPSPHFNIQLQKSCCL